MLKVQALRAEWPCAGRNPGYFGSGDIQEEARLLAEPSWELTVSVHEKYDELRMARAVKVADSGLDEDCCGKTEQSIVSDTSLGK